VPPVDLLGSDDGEARLIEVLKRIDAAETKKNARRWPGV
jgi:hypothetical protein